MKLNLFNKIKIIIAIYYKQFNKMNNKLIKEKEHNLRWKIIKMKIL